MKDLSKLMMMKEHGEGEQMSQEDIMAKLDVIREMMEAMQEVMGGRVKSGLDEYYASQMPQTSLESESIDLDDDDLDDDDLDELEDPNSMKEVSVAAPDEEGLMAGLAAAQEITPAVIEEEEDHNTFFGKKKDRSKFR